MNKILDKKKAGLFMLLFSIIYFTSYISRINFGAVIVEMVSAEGFLKADLSLAVTAAFITYGVGQLISGVLGDRINPKYLMFFGLLLTAGMNALIPFCKNTTYMIAVWAVNGFAQSFMWPPLVKIMTMLFDADTYRTATVRVSWGSSAGTIAVYLIAPICISTVGWKGSFWFPAIFCVIMAFFWLIALRNTDTSVSAKAENKSDDNGKNASPFGAFALGAIVIGIVIQGALRDGITTWMPTFINETYNLGSKISILTGVILPIFSILCFNLTHKLRSRCVQNELLLAGYIFIAGVLASALLYFTSSKNAVLSILFMALLTGSMHGVNLLLVCMVPSYFKKSSTASGVLNAFTYIGSAISTFGIAVLSEKFGWSNTILIWCAFAIVGAICCLSAVRRKKA